MSVALLPVRQRGLQRAVAANTLYIARTQAQNQSASAEKLMTVPTTCADKSTSLADIGGYRLRMRPGLAAVSHRHYDPEAVPELPLNKPGAREDAENEQR